MPFELYGNGGGTGRVGTGDSVGITGGVGVGGGEPGPHGDVAPNVVPGIGVGNPTTNATRNSNGQITGGFGFMNVNSIATGTARNMLVVARIAF